MLNFMCRKGFVTSKFNIYLVKLHTSLLLHPHPSYTKALFELLYSKSFGGKTFGELRRWITAICKVLYLLPIFTISIALLYLFIRFHNYLLPINIRKATWFAVAYTSTYAYMHMEPHLFMAIISTYSYSYIACNIAIVPADSFIYNELTITSRPNVCHFSVFLWLLAGYQKF